MKAVVEKISDNLSSENLSFSGVRTLTGTPGSGKTLRMAYFMEQANKQGMNVFICNNDTFRFPFLQTLDDARDWATLPPNSVLFIDEAQKFFRQRRGNVEVPDYLTDMETLRHRGIAIVMTTQKPTYLDTHIRGLGGIHEHLVQSLGNADSATVHQWRELQEDVKSQSVLDSASKFTWPYPKHLYSVYDSAEVHTKKKFMPAKQKLLYALIAGVLLCFGFVGYRMFNRGSIVPLVESSAATAATTPQGEFDPSDLKTVADFLRAQTPVISTQPWTAPMYGDMKPQGAPMLYCISSGIDGADGCNCITEQGTTYLLPLNQCKLIARNGLYNPNKQPSAPVQVKEQPFIGSAPASLPRALSGSNAKPYEVGSPDQGKVW